jgi:peptidoglycan/LPS O-acetylase OafA/YrhL
MADTVSTGLDLRSNALNAVRLALATLVIVSHSFPIAGKGPDPAWGGISLGTLAVGGFFAISGYLITNSRLRSGLGSYAWRRFLRIFPGFWVCLLFTAFVAAPLGGLARGGYSASSALHYVVSYADMSNPAVLAPQTLAGAPYDASWNGSLWSLRYEVACYVVTGVVLLSAVFWRRWLVALAFLAGSLFSLGMHLSGHVSGTLSELALLAPYFLAGVLILRFADRVPLSGAGVAASVVALALAGVVGQGEALFPLPLAYLLVWIGARAPLRVRRVGAKNDISYGTYLYAFPIQQLLVVAGLAALPVGLFAAASFLCTIPVAAASWFVVERPAMTAKHLPARWRRGASLAPRKRRGATADTDLDTTSGTGPANGHDREAAASDEL